MSCLRQDKGDIVLLFTFAFTAAAASAAAAAVLTSRGAFSGSVFFATAVTAVVVVVVTSLLAGAAESPAPFSSLVAGVVVGCDVEAAFDVVLSPLPPSFTCKTHNNNNKRDK